MIVSSLTAYAHGFAVCQRQPVADQPPSQQPWTDHEGRNTILEDAPIYFMSKKEATTELSRFPPACFLFHCDATIDSPDTYKGYLILAVKYRTVVRHFDLSTSLVIAMSDSANVPVDSIRSIGGDQGVELIDVKANQTRLCGMTQERFSWFNRLTSEFLPKFREFLLEVVYSRVFSDVNLQGRSLGDKDLLRLLAARAVIALPQSLSILLYRFSSRQNSCSSSFSSAVKTPAQVSRCAITLDLMNLQVRTAGNSVLVSCSEPRSYSFVQLVYLFSGMVDGAPLESIALRVPSLNMKDVHDAPNNRAVDGGGSGQTSDPTQGIRTLMEPLETYSVTCSRGVQGAMKGISAMRCGFEDELKFVVNDTLNQKQCKHLRKIQTLASALPPFSSSATQSPRVLHELMPKLLNICCVEGALTFRTPARSDSKVDMIACQEDVVSANVQQATLLLHTLLQDREDLQSLFVDQVWLHLSSHSMCIGVYRILSHCLMLPGVAQKANEMGLFNTLARAHIGLADGLFGTSNWADASVTLADSLYSVTQEKKRIFQKSMTALASSEVKTESPFPSSRMHIFTAIGSAATSRRGSVANSVSRKESEVVFQDEVEHSLPGIVANDDNSEDAPLSSRTGKSVLSQRFAHMVAKSSGAAHGSSRRNTLRRALEDVKEHDGGHDGAKGLTVPKLQLQGIDDAHVRTRRSLRRASSRKDNSRRGSLTGGVQRSPSNLLARAASSAHRVEHDVLRSWVLSNILQGPQSWIQDVSQSHRVGNAPAVSDVWGSDDHSSRLHATCFGIGKHLVASQVSVLLQFKRRMDAKHLRTMSSKLSRSGITSPTLRPPSGLMTGEAVPLGSPGLFATHFDTMSNSPYPWSQPPGAKQGLRYSTAAVGWSSAVTPNEPIPVLLEQSDRPARGQFWSLAGRKDNAILYCLIRNTYALIQLLSVAGSARKGFRKLTNVFLKLRMALSATRLGVNDVGLRALCELLMAFIADENNPLLIGNPDKTRSEEIWRFEDGRSAWSPVLHHRFRLTEMRNVTCPRLPIRLQEVLTSDGKQNNYASLSVRLSVKSHSVLLRIQPLLLSYSNSLHRKLQSLESPSLMEEMSELLALCANVVSALTEWFSAERNTGDVVALVVYDLAGSLHLLLALLQHDFWLLCLARSVLIEHFPQTTKRHKSGNINAEQLVVDSSKAQVSDLVAAWVDASCSLNDLFEVIFSRAAQLRCGEGDAVIDYALYETMICGRNVPAVPSKGVRATELTAYLAFFTSISFLDDALTAQNYLLTSRTVITGGRSVTRVPSTSARLTHRIADRMGLQYVCSEGMVFRARQSCLRLLRGVASVMRRVELRESESLAPLPTTGGNLATITEDFSMGAAFVFSVLRKLLDPTHGVVYRWAALPAAAHAGRGVDLIYQSLRDIHELTFDIPSIASEEQLVCQYVSTHYTAFLEGYYGLLGRVRSASDVDRVCCHLDVLMLVAESHGASAHARKTIAAKFFQLCVYQMLVRELDLEHEQDPHNIRVVSDFGNRDDIHPISDTPVAVSSVSRRIRQSDSLVSKDGEDDSLGEGESVLLEHADITDWSEMSGDAFDESYASSDPTRAWSSSPARSTTNKLGLSLQLPLIGANSNAFKLVPAESPGGSDVDKSVANMSAIVVDADGGASGQPDKSYRSLRDTRPLYAHPELHVRVIRMVLRLLVEPDGDVLSTLYVARQSPSQAFNTAIGYTSLLFVIHRHLNHPDNAAIVKEVIRLEVASACGKLSSYIRLLRLLCHETFNSGMYTILNRIGRGMYSTVYACEHTCMSQSKLALKRIDFPSSAKDANMLSLVFTEISALERARSLKLPRVARLVDYGLCRDSYWIVMEQYDESLRQWRREQQQQTTTTATSDEDDTDDIQALRSVKNKMELQLYFELFLQILKGVQQLHESVGVVHFDLKCDNILIRRVTNAKSGEHEVYLADLGSCWVGERGCRDPRGTENIQAPEVMRLRSSTRTEEEKKTHHQDVVNNSNSHNAHQRSTHDVAAGCVSDVWSLGCLLFELFTGEWLFEDDVDFPIYYQVIDENEPLLRPKKRQLLEHVPEAIALVEFALVRDHSKRPALSEFAARVFDVYQELYGANAAVRLTAVASEDNKKKDRVMLPLERVKSLALRQEVALECVSPENNSLLVERVAMQELLSVQLQVCLDVQPNEDSLSFVREQLRARHVSHVLVVCAEEKQAKAVLGAPKQNNKNNNKIGTPQAETTLQSKVLVASSFSATECRKVCDWMLDALREPHQRVCIVAVGSVDNNNSSIHCAASCLIALLMRIRQYSYLEALSWVSSHWFAGIADENVMHAPLALIPGTALIDAVRLSITPPQ